MAVAIPLRVSKAAAQPALMMVSFCWRSLWDRAFYRKNGRSRLELSIVRLYPLHAPMQVEEQKCSGFPLPLNHRWQPDFVVNLALLHGKTRTFLNVRYKTAADLEAI